MFDQLRESFKKIQGEKFDFKLGEVPLHGRKSDYFTPCNSSDGTKVNKAKIDLIANLLLPTCVKDVSSFLGHAGFYHRCIQNFSEIAIF